MCLWLPLHESAYVNPEWIVADARKLWLSDLLLSEPKGASEGGLTGICHKDPPEGAPRLGGVFFLFTPGIRKETLTGAVGGLCRCLGPGQD